MHRLEAAKAEVDTDAPEPDCGTLSRSDALFPDVKRIRAVACIGRLSGHQKQDIVDKIEANNQKLYAKFQAKEHARIHDCHPGDCIAEFRSFVFNGWSSNTDITSRSGETLDDLVGLLNAVSLENRHVQQTAVIIFSSLDGLFTNVKSMSDFFEPFESVGLLVAMYLGGSEFQIFRMADIQRAIHDIGNRQPGQSPAHDLVSNWMLVAINKLQLSQAHRDNRMLMPRKRNTIDESQVDASSPTEDRLYTDDAKRKRRVDALEIAMVSNGTSVLRYQVQTLTDNSIICPEATCNLHFKRFDDLVSHLAARSKALGLCVLCPEPRIWKAPMKKSHLLSHLPPSKKCIWPGCSFETRTRTSLNLHMKTHQGNGRRTKPHKCTHEECEAIGVRFHTKGELDDHVQEVHQSEPDRVICPLCGDDFADKYKMQRHQDSGSCRNISRAAFQHLCPECGQAFDQYISMRYHLETIHKRNAGIMEFAVDAGFLDTGHLPQPASILAAQARDKPDEPVKRIQPSKRARV